MTEYSIPVTGELDLEIEGQLLFQNDNSRINGSDSNRYHELNIYEASDSKGNYYLLHIYYCTHWQGESHISEAWECETEQELVAQLYAYNPISHLRGYPTGERFDEKQERLKQSIIFNWKELMISALKELGIKRPKGRSKPTNILALDIDSKLKAEAIKSGLDLNQILEQAVKDALR